jgi:hypothetical protein
MHLCLMSKTIYMMNKDMVFCDATKKLVVYNIFYIFDFNSKNEIFKILNRICVLQHGMKTFDFLLFIYLFEQNVLHLFID